MISLRSLDLSINLSKLAVSFFPACLNSGRKSSLGGSSPGVSGNPSNMSESEEREETYEDNTNDKLWTASKERRVMMLSYLLEKSVGRRKESERSTRRSFVGRTSWYIEI